MKKYLLSLTFVTFVSICLLGQKVEDTDTSYTLKETIISYQANKRTPITFQNISRKEIQIKSVGQEPSFFACRNAFYYQLF